jgi:hypothetical protein
MITGRAAQAQHVSPDASVDSARQQVVSESSRASVSSWTT